MDTRPNLGRLYVLDLTGFKLGESVLFCPQCTWQATEPVGMKPVCPKCTSPLHSVRVDETLIRLRGPAGPAHDAFDLAPAKNPPFTNGLTEAETERLALLMEEMAEASQVIGKILRHGYESRWPDKSAPSNRELLTKELGHVAYALCLMEECRDISGERLGEAQREKASRIHQYLHHQDPQALRLLYNAVTARGNFVEREV